MRERRASCASSGESGTGDELAAEHFPHEIVATQRSVEIRNTLSDDPWESWLNEHPSGPLSLESVNERVEQHLIRWALETSRHNRTRAAELLGLSKVDQLRYLMRKHSID